MSTLIRDGLDDTWMRNVQDVTNPPKPRYAKARDSMHHVLVPTLVREEIEHINLVGECHPSEHLVDLDLGRRRRGEPGAR